MAILTEEDWRRLRTFIEKALALRLLPNIIDASRVWNAAYAKVGDLLADIRRLAHIMKPTVNTRNVEYMALSALAYDLKAMVQDAGELLNENGAHRLLLEVHTPSLPPALKALHYDIEQFLSRPMEAAVREAHEAYVSPQKQKLNTMFMLKTHWPGMLERPLESTLDQPMPFV